MSFVHVQQTNEATGVADADRASSVELKPLARDAGEPEQIEDPVSGPASAPVPKLSPRVWIASVAAIIVCSTWAMWPISSHEFPTVQPTPATAASPNADRAQLAQLSVSAFATPLWVAPIPPPQPPPAPPPPPPLKLQLVGIVKSNSGGFAAMIYDPDSGKLLTLIEGEAIGRRTVESVGESSVVIKDRTGSRTLTLKDTGAAAATPASTLPASPSPASPAPASSGVDQP